MATPYHVIHNTSLLIRDFFMKYRRGSPSQVHFYVKSMKKRYGYKAPTYYSTWKYLWILRQIGLIRRIGYEPNTYGPTKQKPIYEAVPEKLSDSAWQHPQSTLYPATRLGAERYRKLKEAGIEPRGRGKGF